MPGRSSAPAPPVPDRRRAKRKAAWRRRRLVLLLMSPWLVGFSVFFGYPLVMSVYLSFTHYDLSTRRDGRSCQLPLHVQKDPQFWPAIKNTLWIIAVGVPLQVLFAFGDCADVDAGQARCRVLPHRLLPAGARTARRGHARLRLPAQPRRPAR